MADDSTDLGVSPGKWNGLIRRARISRQLKHAALTVSSYADKHGRDVKCGVARLAADCDIGYSTARRYLAWLREVGLIELVHAGSYKRGLADEYRLIIDEAKHGHLDIPDGEEYRRIVDEVNSSNQSSQKGRRLRDQRSPKESANATDQRESSALTTASANDGYQRSFGTPSALIQGEPPPSNDHLVSEVRPSTGGAPPPDPRRPEPPTASGSRLDAEQEISAAHHPAQDLQRNSLPHTRGQIGVVVDILTRRAI
jgi:hypothetical protein